MLLLSQYVTQFWNSIIGLTGLRLVPAPLGIGNCSEPGPISKPQQEARTGSTTDHRGMAHHLSIGRNHENAVRLHFYGSLIQLRRTLTHLTQDYDLPLATVVLVLDRHFSGHLPSLIQRSNSRSRLILVVESGFVPLPGTVTIGDLAAREGALGWQQIVFERDLEAAIRGSLQTLEPTETMIVLSPSWHSLPAPLQRFNRTIV